uniref:Metallo-beta-lactamase domain-containing protein n=1 Tax=Rhodopseudomonas palustris (strain DX-1) TaxID=652103 RepID=E6VER6_RHOPX
MYFSLDVLRARQGDCLMLHYGTEDRPRLMLIDGGPATVYAQSLKPRLQRLRAVRERAGLLDGADPLPIDVVLVSHIDDDHIRGILDLTHEQRRRAAGLRLAVTSLWHNSFDDLLSTKPDELTSGFGTASILAGADANLFAGVEIGDSEEEAAAQAVLASVPQGRTLRDDAADLGWKPNHKFKGKLILTAPEVAPVDLNGVSITVAGPMQKELQALQDLHDQWLRRRKSEDTRPTASAMLAAFVDKSVPNLSSIVLLAECGGKTMLLTGDARGDKIIEGLEVSGRLAKDGTLHVDLLKVPHHGSDNNMETSFFERVTADHYVFSGNGDHGNPERATLQMLLDARGVDDDYTIHLTYPVEEIDVAREADWTKQQAKEANRAKPPKGGVRPDWSAEEQGLVAFFADNPELAAKVKIVADGKPHLIDLLDQVMV